MYDWSYVPERSGPAGRIACESCRNSVCAWHELQDVFHSLRRMRQDDLTIHMLYDKGYGFWTAMTEISRRKFL